MNRVEAVLISLIPLLTVIGLNPKIIELEEPNYLPSKNGTYNSVYHILSPGQEPQGKETILSTRLGNIPLKREPSSLSPTELATVRQMGIDYSHKRTAKYGDLSGKIWYFTYDDRKQTAQEVIDEWIDFDKSFARQKTPEKTSNIQNIHDSDYCLGKGELPANFPIPDVCRNVRRIYSFDPQCEDGNSSCSL